MTRDQLRTRLAMLHLALDRPLPHRKPMDPWERLVVDACKYGRGIGVKRSDFTLLADVPLAELVRQTGPES